MPTARSLKWATALTKKESVYGTQIADGSLVDHLKMSEIDFADVDTQFRIDEEDLTGFAGPTEHEVESKTGSLARKFKASCENIGAFLAWQLGRITSSGTNPDFSHDAQWPLICTLNPPSYSLVEGLDCVGSSGTFLLYKGVVVDQFSLEVEGKSPVMLTLGNKHDGSETAKGSFAFPAGFVAENKLLGSMKSLKFGPLGTEDLTSILRTLKITINSGITEPPGGSAGVFVAEYQYADKRPDLAIELSLKADKSHAVYGYQGVPPTVVKFDFLLQKSASRSVRLVCTRGVCTVKQAREGNEPRLNVTFLPEWNSTDGGPGKWTVKNGIASYLNP